MIISIWHIKKRVTRASVSLMLLSGYYMSPVCFMTCQRSNTMEFENLLFKGIANIIHKCGIIEL